VAQAYLNAGLENPIRQSLGRSGANLGAGDDSDLSWTSSRLGLGFGRFPELKLTHLISKGRLTADYISSLFAGFAGSGIILDHLWGRPAKPPGLANQLITLMSSMLRGNKVERMIAWRSFWAKRRAWALLNVSSTNPTPVGASKAQESAPD
jgi:hypothetical protein